MKKVLLLSMSLLLGASLSVTAAEAADASPVSVVDDVGVSTKAFLTADLVDNIAIKAVNSHFDLVAVEPEVIGAPQYTALIPAKAPKTKNVTITKRRYLLNCSIRQC